MADLLNTGFLSGSYEDQKLKEEANTVLFDILMKIYHPWNLQLMKINPDMFNWIMWDDSAVLTLSIEEKRPKLFR